jgi:hypothetical protein
MKPPEATVLWLRDCSGLFPHVVFSGDSDASTEGWLSLTASSRQEVVIARLTPTESQAGHFSIPAALTRISAVLGRRDLHAVHLVRAEPAPSAKGVSFGAYRQVAGRSRLVYSALSGAGESIPEREESIAEFQANGGIFTRADA